MDETLKIFFKGSIKEFETWIKAQKDRYATLEEFIIDCEISSE